MDDEKSIFPYRDGDGRERKGDPVELLRRLTSCLRGQPNEFFQRAESEDPETANAANEVIGRAVCKAFRLGEPWDDLKGAGVKEAVWQETLDDFLEWLEKNGPPADGGPTSPPPSAPPS